MYRVRISNEVVAAAGQDALRRVPVPQNGAPPRILTFSREWLELADLPDAVRGDPRLEIEHREDTASAWQPFDRTERSTPPQPPAATADASYADLQQAAKALGLKAQGTRAELAAAVDAALASADTEVLGQALALLGAGGEPA